MVNAKDFNVDRETNGPQWWCIALVKIAAVIAAIVCGISGLTTCFTSLVAPVCIGAGIIMIGISFLLFLLEAPVCCMFFESTKKLSDWLQGRKHWHKGLIYIILSIIPIIMCQAVGVIVGCVCSFAIGVIYGLMSLGRKASRQEMSANAKGGDFSDV